MDIGIERQNWQRACAAEGEDSRPEWAGLRARFIAALAARDALRNSAAQGINGRASGSFDSSSARQIGSYGHGLPPINPVVLSDGKSGRGIRIATAGTSITGGRG